MEHDSFERLLDALPKIAESVKQFESEAVQQQVIDGLLQTLMVGANPDADLNVWVDERPNRAPENDLGERVPDPSSNGQVKTGAQQKKKSKPLPRVDAVDFDWSPEGVESLAEFVDRKKPATMVDRNLVVVFYLSEIVKQQPITVGHIVSAFYSCGWNVPADPFNSVSVARSKAKGIDTSNRNELVLTHIGRNIVNNQLPRPAKTK